VPAGESRALFARDATLFRVNHTRVL